MTRDKEGYQIMTKNSSQIKKQKQKTRKQKKKKIKRSLDRENIQL